MPPSFDSFHTPCSLFSIYFTFFFISLNDSLLPTESGKGVDRFIIFKRVVFGG